jgi:hypothetical protein
LFPVVKGLDEVAVLPFERLGFCVCDLNCRLKFPARLSLVGELILELGFSTSAHLQVGFGACVLSLVLLDFSSKSLDSPGLLGLFRNLPCQSRVGL